MPTDLAALDALYPLFPEELFRQWVLTRDPAAIPAEWERRTMNGWHLGFHPDAQVCDLRASDGTPAGWIMEPLVYLDGTGSFGPKADLTLSIHEPFTAAEIERALYGRDSRGRSSGDGLEGMWVALVFGGTDEAPFRRVYLSPTHSIVYSMEQGAVATTHNLVPNFRRDEVLSRAFDPLATKSYFTFGLTAFTGVRRLLPNQYLDLDTFRPVRHWPLEAWEPFARGAEGAAAIVDHARRLLDGLSGSYDSFRVPLSAGRDSRAVLACLRPLVEDRAVDVLLSTVVGPDVGSRTDLQTARRLARIAGLRHEVRQRQAHDSKASDVLRSFARIGESKSGPSLSAPGIKERRPRDLRFCLAGMAGETGRSFYWGRSYSSGSGVSANTVTPESLARHTRSPATDAVMEAADAWLSGLPEHVRASTPDTLDLAYVEQRLGCWEASTRYLFPGRPRVTSPMATAFNIEAMLRLPVDYRAARTLQRDMVAYGWPELLAVPFNAPSGLLRLPWYAQRGRRVLDKVRRRLRSL